MTTDVRQAGVARPSRGTTGAIWTLILMVLVAFTLRPPVTAIAPLLESIQRDLGVGSSFGGVLTTLPVVCLGAFAFVAPKLRQHFGDEPVLIGCLLVLLVGNLLRSFGVEWALLGGTVVVGAGIAVANVALPGLIKRDFPERVPSVTAAYTMCLTLGGAAAASAVVPIGQALGSAWRAPLGLLVLPVVLALVVSAFALRGRGKVATDGATARPGALWRDKLAWQVTAFMGLQSLLAYVVFGWLPSMVASRGLSPELAGLLLGLQSAIQAVGSLTVPLLCRKLGDQRGIAAAVGIASAVGFAGILLAPAPAGVWGFTIVLGLAQGMAFGLALTLFGLRSPDSDTTAALSAMGQGIGYLIAALGPLAIGLVHDASGGWVVPLGLLLIVCVAEAGVGLLAGRRVQVSSVDTGRSAAGIETRA